MYINIFLFLVAMLHEGMIIVAQQVHVNVHKSTLTMDGRIVITQLTSLCLMVATEQSLAEADHTSLCLK